MTADAGLQSLIRAASGGDRPPRGFLTRFAERIGVSTSTVSRWREGTVPDAEWWPKLADALDLSEAEVRQAATSARRSPDTMADLRARIDRVESRLAALDGHMTVIETTLEELRAQRRNTRSAATD
jgi:DNA-binding transcriptional regulator YdaS (Cro superfamily)